MRKTRSVDFVVRLVVLGGAAAALIGCESIRQAAGVEKTPPDEFAVVTKAPLVIPPNFNLRPPKPGAPPTNQSSPTDSAEAALSGTDPATVAAGLPNTYSPAEKNLLANTGGAMADKNIRAQIAADDRSMVTASDSFTDELLFRSPPDPDAGHPVNADAEHDRLVAEKTDGHTPVEGLRDNAGNTKESATINKSGKDNDNVKDEDNGWFDGWFDGIF